MALPLHNCSYCPKPSANFCFVCDCQLCEKHASNVYHECPTEGDAYYEEYAKTTNNNFSALLSSIDTSDMLNIAVEIRKVPSATSIILNIPATRDEALMGGKHLHLPLTFKNGDKWAVRVALQGGSTSPQELLVQEMNSEVATLIALESADVRIAKTKSRCIIPKGLGTRPPYFFLEWIDGKSSFTDAEILQKNRWINEIAKEFIKLEKLSYNAIGSLTFKSEDKPDLFVGPMVEPGFCGRDKYGRLSQLGPFENAQDFRIAQVQQVLAQIEGGFKYSQNSVDAYLIHLEVIDLIKILYPTCQDPHQFYIKHADDKGDHWIIRGDLFVGTIDWEWAYTTTKEEAFAAPLAFVDVGAFYDGYNGLSELENTFVTAFESLERPDLAALVRGGKKYQRLPFVIGSHFSDLPNLFLAFRQLVLGIDSKPTFEEWKKEAWGKYKGHPFLALKMMT